MLHLAGFQGSAHYVEASPTAAIDVDALLNNPVDPVVFRLYIASTAKIIGAAVDSGPLAACLLLTGIPAGTDESIITIFNNGKMYGRAANGGDGAGNGQTNGEVGMSGGYVVNKSSAQRLHIYNPGEMFAAGGGGGGCGRSVEDGLTIAGCSGGGSQGSTPTGYGLPGSPGVGDPGSNGISGTAGSESSPGIGGKYPGPVPHLPGIAGNGGAWATNGTAAVRGTFPDATNTTPGGGGQAGVVVNIPESGVTWWDGNDATHRKG